MCSRKGACQPQQGRKDHRSAHILDEACGFNSLFVEDVLFLILYPRIFFFFFGIEDMNVGGPTHFILALSPPYPHLPPLTLPSCVMLSILFLQSFLLFVGLSLPLFPLEPFFLTLSLFIPINGFLCRSPSNWLNHFMATLIQASRWPK